MNTVACLPTSRQLSSSILLKDQCGFGLLEVIISILISVVTILGFYSLQGKAQKSEIESIQREQALRLVNFIVNQISANRSAAGCYALSQELISYVGTGYIGPYTCTSAGVIETQNQVNADINQWSNMLSGTYETLDNENVGAMIGARGCISYDSTNRTFMITVAWQGLSSVTQASTNTCAINMYGNTNLRRTVSVDVNLADLGT